MEERFQTFTVLIAHISRSIRRIKTEEMAEFNLKSHHVSCLYYLYRGDRLTAKELCDISEEDKANISRSIEYLEKNGYLVSHPKAHKRYKTPLELTDLGRAVGRRIEEKIRRVLFEAGEGLSDESRRVMYESLSVVCDNLQRICDRYENQNESPNQE